MIKRTHTCGELTEKNLGQKVSLNGWISKSRDLGGLIFIDLRDRYGITQIVFNEELIKFLSELREKNILVGIITNQPHVAQGRCNLAELRIIKNLRLKLSKIT